jgi:hypothetical protein
VPLEKMDELFYDVNATEVVGSAPSQSLLESNISYYVAVAAILLAALFVRPSPSKHHGVDAPFYKATRMKWMFSADTLVMDSYRKVSNPSEIGAASSVLSTDLCSSGIESIRSKQPREYGL